jgi:polyketide cyclase/dehydrase/lipid transport protein
MLPILLALAFIAILLIIVVAGQPDEFKLARSTNISAPPEKIFPHVNNLLAWQAWSPWAKLDPNAQIMFKGPASGVSATMSWGGNKKIGAGIMTITESQPSEMIRFKLEFIRPFKATNAAEFNFRPDGNQTEVTWTMTGKSNFFFKVFGLFMNCDDMAGKDFEKGLSAMKSVVETN